ncbi:nucleoside deaminase [Alkalihalobacillus trypoxylicola]|uniref:Cytidine deaminase n=1 Tax=Alkalihalobacillus trypoxylicola TaxID=519424 RepID=A0A162F3K8_9BACI|nr:nucleoside deaminase [Alkalihalobacillus trypoxylicola]KYG34418.1 cytidine deaminase [Alkalihalobacillus trypoxylicola]
MEKKDLSYLNRCLELAEKAVAEGNQPFGSILVSKDGEVLFEDHNRISEGDLTLHPELSISRWASKNLTAEERSSSTVYTSGEHCPMCASAHGLVGLGRIVYASSTAQLLEWRKELNKQSPKVKPLFIQDVLPEAIVDGPVAELAIKIKELHRQAK